METPTSTTNAPRRRILDDLNPDRTSYALVAVGLVFFALAIVGAVTVR